MPNPVQIMKIIYYAFIVAGEDNFQVHRHILSLEVLDEQDIHTKIHQEHSQITIVRPYFLWLSQTPSSYDTLPLKLVTVFWIMIL